MMGPMGMGMPTGVSGAPLTASEPLGFGWRRVSSDWVTTIIGTFAVSIACGMPGSIVQQFGLRSGGDIRIVTGIGQLLSLVGGAFAAGGIMNASLKICRGQPCQIGDYFSGGKWFVNVLVAELLVGLAVLIGLPFLIVPAIIIALGLFVTIPLVVDRDMGAIDAMKESWRLTNGYKGTIFVFGLLCFLLCIAGAIPCGLGLLPLIPAFYIAQVYIYLRLSGQPTVQG